MDPRSYGPQIFPSAPLVKKRWEARLDELPPLREPAGDTQHPAAEDGEAKRA